MAAAEKPDCVPLEDAVSSSMKKDEVLKVYLDAALKLGLIDLAESVSQKYSPSKALPQLAKFKKSPKGTFHTANCPLCDTRFEYAQEYSAHFRAGGCAVYRVVCGNYVVKRANSRELVQGRLGAWAAALIEEHTPSSKAGGAKRPRGSNAEPPLPFLPAPLLFAQSGKEDAAAQVLALLPSLPDALSPFDPPASGSGSAAAAFVPAVPEAPPSTTAVKLSKGVKKGQPADQPSSTLVFSATSPPHTVLTASDVAPVHEAPTGRGTVLAMAMHAAEPPSGEVDSSWVTFAPLQWSGELSSSPQCLSSCSFRLSVRATSMSFAHHVALGADGSYLRLLAVCHSTGPASVFLLGVARLGQVQCWLLGSVPAHQATHTSCAWSPHHPMLLATVSDNGAVAVTDASKLVSDKLQCEVFHLSPEQEFAACVDGSCGFEARCVWSWEWPRLLFATLPLRMLAINVDGCPSFYELQHQQRALGGVMALHGSARGVLAYQTRKGSQVNQITIQPRADAAGAAAESLERTSLSQLAEDLNGQVHGCCSVLLPSRGKADTVMEVLALAVSGGGVELRGLTQALALSTHRWAQQVPRAAGAHESSIAGLSGRCASARDGRASAFIVVWSSSAVELVCVELAF